MCMYKSRVLCENKNFGEDTGFVLEKENQNKSAGRRDQKLILSSPIISEFMLYPVIVVNCTGSGITIAN